MNQKVTYQMKKSHNSHISMTDNTVLETGRLLHLTLKKKWFDMIASGEKKEEYREMKPYWTKRLFNDLGDRFEPKSFDKVVFKNGYASNAPTMVLECLGIQKDLGMMTWGAEQDVEYYIIQLGEILFRSSH